jgi:hypothetical protein
MIVVATDEGTAGRRVYMGQVRGDGQHESVVVLSAQGRTRVLQVPTRLHFD